MSDFHNQAVKDVCEVLGHDESHVRACIEQKTMYTPYIVEQRERVLELENALQTLKGTMRNRMKTVEWIEAILAKGKP